MAASVTSAADASKRRPVQTPVEPQEPDYALDSKTRDLFGDERNADVFRLAILGFATLEDRLSEGIAEAFGGEIPHDLRYLRSGIEP